ncbi:SusC/RagA family TonB-linked outer membrane protein [Parapedobacter indicus]|uniref:TonB-linked outer membrane protein, SusC/RagA family n=1 Tax=Parapedobacter indicus TaxID=1477437 RepID=A0A1I3SD78_9SPHI|nr:TonB-dependent receptor [Parapedobacter indicus]PPK99852.1 TonB-linked SusC/RagA family outer membrane protein [Parapedobacter indicus]SFJ56678.1 TonB-linked outer membrane protein, SusC/RagA family [Parapedobacter indicus]
MKKIKHFLVLFTFLPGCLVVLGQTKRISGTVTSSGDGTALNGVSIWVKGSERGTTTDESGVFAIDAAKGDTLRLTYVGYRQQDVVVGEANALTIRLELSAGNLDEVVVVGYGTQKKQDITGAITSISTQALREVPATSAPQMLQGRAAGVDVVHAGNKPGAGVTVRVRGRRSFNAGNDPLYVVDGIPISGGFNDINPDDIESIDVLKDASATAIYGSRGANGVVLVTTKRGKSGRTNIHYDAYYGSSTIMRYAELMNGEEFAEYKRESRRAVISPVTGRPLYDDEDPNADVNSGIFDAVELQSITEGRSTDWQRLMIKDGSVQNHGLSVSGGTDHTNFNISLGYFNDVGILKGQDFTRYTTRLNVDQKIGKRVKVGMSTLGSYSERNGEDVNPYNAGADFGTLTENPLGIPYDENGNIIFRPTSDGLRTNPLLEIVPGAVINKSKVVRLFSSIYGEAEVFDGLKFRMNFGPDLRQDRKGDFRGSLTNARQGGDPAANNAENFAFQYAWENILTYQKTLSEKHQLDITGLYSVQSLQQEGTTINVLGLPVESLEYYNLGAASTINSVGSDYEKWTILSYMARINYIFDQRFLLTLTGRADGSSKFSTGNKWGYFPSLALGWNLKNEQFLQESNLFSNLKLRLSYGETGNEGIMPYQTQGLVSRTVYDFDGSSAFGYRPSTIRNDGLKWETTKSANIGLDFGLWNNRVTGAIEVYQSRTTDLLLPRVLPITSGYNSILSNVGVKRNRGLEVSVSSLNIVSNDEQGFEWATDLNLYTNQEQILELSQGKVDDIGNLRFIGHPAVVYYDYVKAGIWQLGQEGEAEQYSSIVGGVKVKDVNGNGVIDPDDRQILGSDIPKLSGGLTNRFRYKGFDLSIFAFARLGGMIQSTEYGTFRFLSGRVNQYRVDYWTKDNPTNAFPQPNSNLETPYFGSTLRYFSGSFVKIRNINLGYNFSERIARSIGAQSLRIYLSAQNPLVFSEYVSKYSGLDPENPTNSTPPSRVFLAGLNVRF